jgi:hypothetical protein
VTTSLGGSDIADLDELISIDENVDIMESVVADDDVFDSAFDPDELMTSPLFQGSRDELSMNSSIGEKAFGDFDCEPAESNKEICLHGSQCDDFSNNRCNKEPHIRCEHDLDGFGDFVRETSAISLLDNQNEMIVCENRKQHLSLSTTSQFPGECYGERSFTSPGRTQRSPTRSLSANQAYLSPRQRQLMQLNMNSFSGMNDAYDSSLSTNNSFILHSSPRRTRNSPTRAYSSPARGVSSKSNLLNQVGQMSAPSLSYVGLDEIHQGQSFQQQLQQQDFSIGTLNRGRNNMMAQQQQFQASMGDLEQIQHPMFAQNLQRPLGLSQTVHGTSYPSNRQVLMGNSYNDGTQKRHVQDPLLGGASQGSAIFNSMQGNVSIASGHQSDKPHFSGLQAKGVSFGSETPANINTVMEKLSDSMRRSAMSRSMIKQLSARNMLMKQASVNGPMMGSHMMRQNSDRSLLAETSGRSVPIRRMSNSKHHLHFPVHGISRQSSQQSLNGSSSHGISLHIDGRNMGNF